MSSLGICIIFSVIISSYVTISGGFDMFRLSCRQGVVGMNENHISSDFLSDDLPANAEPKDGRVNGSNNEIVRMEDGLDGAATAGSSRIVDFAVARAIAGFELSMLVLTGRNINLVQRSPNE